MYYSVISVKKIILKIKKNRREGPDEERNSIGDVEAVSQPSPLPEGTTGSIRVFFVKTRMRGLYVKVIQGFSWKRGKPVNELHLRRPPP